jgi:hypothetical protein
MVSCSKLVIVCGTPGSWCNLVCKRMYQKGFKVLWEDQPQVGETYRYFSKNFQNAEINEIHRQLLNTSQPPELFSTSVDYYEDAYPGPVEFLSKFGTDSVVLSSNSMGLLLDVWLPFATMVVDVRATEQEDLDMINKWASVKLADSVIKKIRDIHVSAYLRHVASFENTIQITNSEIRSPDRFNHLMGKILSKSGASHQTASSFKGNQ